MWQIRLQALTTKGEKMIYYILAHLLPFIRALVHVNNVLEEHDSRRAVIVFTCGSESYKMTIEKQ